MLVDLVDTLIVFKGVKGFFHEGDRLRLLLVRLAILLAAVELNCLSLDNLSDYMSKQLVSRSDLWISKVGRGCSTLRLSLFWFLGMSHELPE